MLRSSVVVAMVCVASSGVLAGHARFVLVPRSTPLHTAPTDTAPAATDPAAGDTSLGEDDYWVFRKLGDVAGGWVEIATGAPSTSTRDAALPRGGAYQCYSSPNTGGLELHLFVRADQLPAVTTQSVSLQFGDGTSVRLNPGVALGPADPHGVRSVMVDGLRFAIPIPADHVGTSYEADHLTLFPNPHAAEEVGPATLQLDGGKRPVSTDHSLDLLYIHRKSGSLLEVNAACSAFTAALRGAPVKAGDPEPHGELALQMAASIVRHGAVAYWPSGEVVGAVLRDTWLEIEVPGQDLTRRCFGIPLRTADEGGQFVVCFRDQDVRTAPAAHVRGRVAIDPSLITITGELKREAVARTFLQHREALRSCYASSAAGQRKLSGVMTLKLDIAESGEPRRYQIPHGFEEHVDQCVANLLPSLHFSTGGGQVTVPIRFAP